MTKRIALIIFTMVSFTLLMTGRGWAATYYVRADGTAANKAAATGPASTASACMSLAIFNGETFSAGDTITFSSRGGTFTGTSSPLLTIPSSGTDNSEITYEGESGYEPTFDCADTYAVGLLCSSKDSVNIEDMSFINATTSCVSTEGTSTDVTYSRIHANGSGNQGFQMLDASSATYNDIQGCDNADETFSMHQGTAVINGIISSHSTDSASSCVNIIAQTGNTSLTMSDCNCKDFKGNGIWATQPTGGTITLNMNRFIVDGSSSTDDPVDIESSGYVANGLIFNIPASPKYGLVIRTGVAVILNNLTISDAGGGSDGNGIYAIPALTSYNVIIDSVNYATGKSTAVVAWNAYNHCTYNYATKHTGLGVVTYTDEITTNPIFVDSANNDFRLNWDSPCIDTGYNTGNYTLSVDLTGTSQYLDRYWDVGGKRYRGRKAVPTRSSVP